MVGTRHSMHDYFMHYVDFKYIVKYKQRYAKIIQWNCERNDWK